MLHYLPKFLHFTTVKFGYTICSINVVKSILVLISIEAAEMISFGIVTA